jgi:RHS repeat-associated protein
MMDLWSASVFYQVGGPMNTVMFIAPVHSSLFRLKVARLLILLMLWQTAAPFANAFEDNTTRRSEAGPVLPGGDNIASKSGDPLRQVEGDPCPATTGQLTPGAASLVYVGHISGRCNEPFLVSALLSDHCGNAIANRHLDFAIGSQTASATTDTTGVARTSITPLTAVDSATLTVRFAGDAIYARAEDSSTIIIKRNDTIIRYTGKPLIATGKAETVTAVLTQAHDRKPTPNKNLSFEVAGVKVTATTDLNGVATAAVSLPAAASGPTLMRVLFDGDGCYNSASATAEVMTYLPAAFVVWGGNATALSLGQRVNFWGHSWASQVTAGDYQAHGDFKGYADTVNQYRICQSDARTHGTPRLTDSCWSTKPGQSFPPTTIPTYIGVIVSTSIDKSGPRDYGNIAALIVVKVDPEPAYGPTPGKPGFGTISAVIEDGAKIFSKPPAITASQTQPATVLPGQNITVTLNLSNTSTAAATNISINEEFIDPPAPSGTASFDVIQAAGNQTQTFQRTTPAIPVRRDSESTAEYQKRLGDADGSLYRSVGVVSYKDSTGRAYPVIDLASSSRMELPRLTLGLSAPPCVGPSKVVPYTVSVTNLGSAVAPSATATVTFADGTSTTLAISNLEAGKSFSSTVNWTVPAISAKASTETNQAYLARLASFDGKQLEVSASLTWKDVRGNDYGSIDQKCGSTERVPVLFQTSQAPSSMQPGERLMLNPPVQNTGSGNAFQAKIRITNPDATASGTAAFNLRGGSSSTAQVLLAAPAVAAKQAGETDAGYEARLREADNRPIEFIVELEWMDASGNKYGPLTDTLRSTEVLPIVIITLNGPANAQSGDGITYTATWNNVGHADAAGIDLEMALPGGLVQKPQLPGGMLRPGASAQAAMNFTIPPEQPDGQITARAFVNWRDSIENAYGSLSSSVATNVTNPNEPPLVNAGPDQTVLMPDAVRLNGTATDDGRPSGSTLTAAWSKVSGPGTVAFGNANQPVTAAAFSEEGVYVLRLTASDSVLNVSDEATITVTLPPAETPSYTDTASFDNGEGFNIIEDDYKHLFINNTATGFNFIWVAVSSKGTVVKIDTDTGKVLGEYRSSPAGQPKDPSRTTVDHNGNVWASNRDGNSVLRIGLVENGQCVDRNGNGVIDTSTGLGDLRLWPNTNGVDTEGGVETAADECIINYVRVSSGGTRHVSVNAANDVWVSGTSGRKFDLIDGKTGVIKRKETSVGYGGYGGLIDKNGAIWSSRPMLRWDTAKPLKGASGGNWRGYNHDSYGLCIDSKGNVWNTAWDGNEIRKFAPNGSLIGIFKHGHNSAQGCVVDSKGDVWVAHSHMAKTVGHLKNDGTWVGNVAVGNGPTGVAVDAKGKIWTTNLHSRTVSRIDPNAGPIGADGVTPVGAVDFTSVDLKGDLYNYSDMTGSTLIGAPDGGTWTQVFDSRIDNVEWGVIGWNGRICGDGSLTVLASSSQDGRIYSAPVMVTSGADINLPNGRYLKVGVVFKRASGGESPFLYDLSIGTKGYTLPAVVNAPPMVSAGPDQSTTQPNSASLIGSVCDEGRLLGSGLSMSWTKLSGRGTVTFGNLNLPITDASFSEPGEYVLRLTASDSNLTSSDEVTVVVYPPNDPPAVSAGPDQTVSLTNALSLSGTVTDDGLPARSLVATSWVALSGPGTVTFSDPTAAVTTAIFSEVGTYSLRLVGDDSQLANIDDMTVKVLPPNEAPVVSAGADLEIRLPQKASLNGTVSDDGQPSGTLAVSWSKVSGPGTVAFANAKAADTAATFNQPGTHVLRLTVSDSHLSSTDEMTVLVKPPNQPPAVNAGPNQTITLPDSVSLSATVSDDGVPEGSAVTLAWSKVSGPGLIIFSNAGEVATTASFSEAGTYVLRVTASDSALSKSDDTTITVNPNPVNLPPIVNAGPDQTITLPAQAALSGTAGDDKQPPGGTLTVAWSKLSGPGTVVFSKVNAVATAASFSTAGDYVLRLTASDSVLTSADDVAVTVLPVNNPPTVKAGTDQTVMLPNSASMSGTVSDDGQPAGGALTITWSKVSGPGAVEFQDASAAATTATFSVNGSYVLRLTANDSKLSRSDDVTITVTPPNQAPTVYAGPDQTIHMPNTASLKGSVTDDRLPPGTTITATWTKVSGPGAVTFANAKAAATSASFSETGTYVLRLSASDTLLESRDEVTIAVTPPLPPPPAVGMASPADGAEITSRTDVVGSVSNGSWKLEYSMGADPALPGAATWITVASGTGPVSNTVLGSYDPTLLLNGTYAIRLTAIDDAGQAASISRSVIVTGNQKVGNFTVSFEDLSVPVAGLPIQLIRTYDSRDKRIGDFGIGWTLGIRNVRLEKSVELGRYWREISSGGSFPNYCLQPGRANIVTITFPDGRVYKFQATTVKQCQSLAPITFARFAFTPMPGTRGSLVPQGPVDIIVEGAIPGPVELLDASNGELGFYDPTLFRFTDENGFAYIIDQKTGIKSITDLNGNKLTINNDGIIHSSGKSIRFTRDGQGRITQIIDPEGSAMTYSYDANGDLTSFTDRESNGTKFTYNSFHGLLSIVDPRGTQPIRNEYDDNGRLISLTDAFGKKIVYKRELNTREELITDRLGNPTLYEYDSRGNILRVTDAKGEVTTYAYDSRDNKVSGTNALGQKTAFVYNTNDKLISETDPLGNKTSYSYNGRGQVLTIIDARGGVIANTYDAKGALTSTKDALGMVKTFTYNAGGLVASMTDALGNVTRYEYDRAGNQVKDIDQLGNVTTFTYDANGNILSQTSIRITPSGVTENLVIRYQYDRLGRRVKTTYPDGTATQIAYNQVGNIIAAIDQLGRRTSYEYNQMGQLARTTYADGMKETRDYDAEGHRVKFTDRANRATTFAYDSIGRPVKTTHTDGSTTTISHDAIGRVISSTDERGNTTRYEYDPNCGCSTRRTKVIDALNNITSFTYDANDNQVTVTDPNNNTTRFEYDLLNRRISVIFPDDTHTLTSYDTRGQINKKVDQAARTTQFEYDKSGKLEKVIDAAGNVTRYSYDELGNRTTQTDALNHTMRYEYDSMGQRVKRVLPLGMSEAYSYDAIGNLTSRTDFKSKVTTYTYDSMDRLVRKTPDSSLGEPAVSFSYTATGQRASMVDASGTTIYAYDEQDRLISKQAPHGALSYTYDVGDNLLSVQSSNAGGLSVNYDYDALSRLSTVKDNRLPTGLTAYTYDPLGNLSSYVYPNGVRTSYSYNKLNRLTEMTVSKTSTLASYSYTLGAVGNRLSVTELGGRKVAYTYDDLYRLTSETISNDPNEKNGAINYTHDAAGNRLKRASSLATVASANYTYDANDRLSEDSYDDNGNTVASAGKSFIYDFENRIKDVNGQIRIVYDGDGNQVSQTVNGVTTNYLVDTNNLTGHAQVAEEVIGGTVRKVFTYGHDLISQSQLINGQWNVSFYGYDGHGSVRNLTDPSGTITDTYTYDAFGILIHSSGSTPNNYLYAGQRRDPLIGLDYLRARYMNPSTGRFWSMDSYEGSSIDPVSLHKYLYANADPVNSTDPSGNSPLANLNLGLLIRATLGTMNAIGLYVNAKRSIEYGILAFSKFSKGDMWNGVMASGLAVIHAGFAALSFLGLTASANLPPPPPLGLVPAGGAGLEELWQIVLINPAFEKWLWTTLWPAVLGIGGVFAASSEPGHTADWELRNPRGRIRKSGFEESGGTGKPKPSFPEQLASHTERKILEKLADKVNPGDVITIRGTKPPCAPGFGTQGCTPAMQQFAQQHGVKIMYSANGEVWIFNPDGTIIYP